MTFDQIIKEIGEYGPYQRLLYCLLCLTQVTCALQNFAWVFLSALPDHRCELLLEKFVNGSGEFLLPDEVLNRTIPLDKFGKPDSCTRFTVNLSHYDGVSSDWESIFHEEIKIVKKPEPCSSWVFDNSEYSSTVVTEYSLVCNRAWQQKLGNSGFAIGELLGSLITARFADSLGRRRIFLVGLAGHLAFGFLASYAPNYFILFLFRVILGAATIIVYIVGFIMVLELVGPSKRTIACLATGYFHALGYLLTSFFAYFIRTWWLLQVVISIPALAFISYFWLIPESARWLVTHRRYREVKLVLEKEAKFNKKILPQSVVSVLEENHPIPPTKFNSACSLISNSTLLKKSSILFFTWFFNGLLHYGLNRMYTVKGDDHVWCSIQAAIHFVAVTICILTLDRFGRRLPLCISTVIAGIILIIKTFIPSGSKALLISLAMIGNIFICTATDILVLYSSELYPTVVRATGLGLAISFYKGGGILEPAFALLVFYWSGLPYVIVGLGTIISGFAILSLPVTCKRTLPDLPEQNELEDICRNVPAYETDAENPNLQKLNSV